jgi:GAF domain-containing protein
MPIDGVALARFLAALEELEPPEDAAATALEGALEAARTAAAADGVGLMGLGPDGMLRHVGGAGERADLLGRSQEQAGQGPSVDAFFSAHPVESADLAVDERYPVLAALAGKGVGAVLAVPVELGNAPVGTLGVHAGASQRWAEGQRTAVAAQARSLATLLQLAAVYQARAGMIEQLNHALEARILIEQAKGMLMARRGIDAEAAFEQLRRVARASRRTTAEIAQSVLAGQPL